MTTPNMIQASSPVYQALKQHCEDTVLAMQRSSANILQAMDDIGTSWRGSAAVAFAQALEAWLAEQNKAYKMIQGLGENLGISDRRFTQSEYENSGLAGSIMSVING